MTTTIRDILTRAQQRGKEMDLPYQGALTPLEAYELARLQERDKLRQYGAELFEDKRRQEEEREREWRRDRIPVGIIWRDPRDMQGWGGYALDPEEQELLSLIRRAREKRRRA